MWRFVGFVVVAALGGCSFSGKFNGTGISGPSGGGGAGTTPTPSPSGNGLLVVPDLTGKTAAQADATLRAAGFTFDRLEISDKRHELMRQIEAKVGALVDALEDAADEAAKLSRR